MAILVVQRATLGDGQDGDVLGQPGVLQVEEAGVLDAQALVAADELAHGRLPADHPVPRPVMKESAASPASPTKAWGQSSPPARPCHCIHAQASWCGLLTSRRVGDRSHLEPDLGATPTGGSAISWPARWMSLIPEESCSTRLRCCCPPAGWSNVVVPDLRVAPAAERSLLGRGSTRSAQGIAGGSLVED